MGFIVIIVFFGQELDLKIYVMVFIVMLICGYKLENIVQGSMFFNDLYCDKCFYYGLVNFFFGIKWEKDKFVVEKEYKELGYVGCFGLGLFCVSDGFMLFLMYLVSKMEWLENGGG